jgi:hypothetical protein
MSTIRFQLNLDPLQTSNKELMVSHAAKVSKHADIFEVSEAHIDIIKSLQAIHKDKFFLVKVTSLDSGIVTKLVDAVVNMISFVASKCEHFDFTKFEDVKFVADITNVYEEYKYNAEKIRLLAAAYLNKHVKIFNLNINSNTDITLVAPLVKLQSLDAKISINVKGDNSIVDKIVKSKVNIVALVETTADIELYHTLSKKLELHEECGCNFQEEIEKEDASLTVLEFTHTFIKDNKDDVIEKLNRTGNVIHLTNTNKYVQAQIKEVIDDLRVNLKTTTAEVIEKRISTTKDVLESLRGAKLESLGEREVTNEQLEKLKPKIEKYQSDWYGKQYVKRVNSGRVFRTLLDIETDFANKQ